VSFLQRPRVYPIARGIRATASRARKTAGCSAVSASATMSRPRLKCACASEPATAPTTPSWKQEWITSSCDELCVPNLRCRAASAAAVDAPTIGNCSRGRTALSAPRVFIPTAPPSQLPPWYITTSASTWRGTPPSATGVGASAPLGQQARPEHTPDAHTNHSPNPCKGNTPETPGRRTHRARFATPTIPNRRN
jgi:hypothetical protein